MKPVDRFQHYRDDELDALLLKIKRGEIKCGRYAHLVKIDKKLKIGRVFKIEESDNKSK